MIGSLIDWSLLFAWRAPSLLAPLSPRRAPQAKAELAAAKHSASEAASEKRRAEKQLATAERALETATGERQSVRASAAAAKHAQPITAQECTPHNTVAMGPVDHGGYKRGRLEVGRAVTPQLRRRALYRGCARVLSVDIVRRAPCACAFLNR